MQESLEDSVGVQMLRTALELKRRAVSHFFWTLTQAHAHTLLTSYPEAEVMCPVWANPAC